ncbi:MAG TPA: hypothetical protein VL128_16010 [Candidatus Eisenbacteria bacterium]|nr:hypothetical protein [Candidatus Eisenbacteria bacterium]
MKALEQNLTMMEPQVENRLHGPQSLQASAVLIRPKREEVTIPSGLVISGDPRMRGVLGEALLLCGVAPVLANSLEHAVRHIKAEKVDFAVCQDRLPDGHYKELLLMRHAFGKDLPLIVVSRVGDWPEYFEALDLGASDYLAYPLIPGELQRIVRGLLRHEHIRQPPAEPRSQDDCLLIDSDFDQAAHGRQSGVV